MRNRQLQMILIPLAILIGFGAIFVLNDALDREKIRSVPVIEDEDLYLSSERIKALSGDFNGLVADWYWMNSLQYIGRKIVKGADETGHTDTKDLRPLNPKLLYPMLDRTTTLDPGYKVAYVFGAVMLPAIDEEQAIKLTEKGISEDPESFTLYHHLAYIYWQRGDYEKAGEVYEAGSRTPNAPAFFKQMAAKVRLEGGSRETAREIYQQIYDTAEDTATKELIALRLLQLDSLEEQDAIQNALRTFVTQNKRCTESWDELFPLLRTARLPNGKGLKFMSPNIPVDPTGVPYRIFTKDDQCVVKVSTQSKIPPG